MGRWSRAIQLPDRADTSQIHASIEHGLLILQVAKLPEQQPRQVTVKVGQKHEPLPASRVSAEVISHSPDERSGS
jgi:hypothetical protein